MAAGGTAGSTGCAQDLHPDGGMISGQPADPGQPCGPFSGPRRGGTGWGIPLWYYPDYPYAVKPTLPVTGKARPVMAGSNVVTTVSRAGAELPGRMRWPAMPRRSARSGVGGGNARALETYWQSGGGTCLWQSVRKIRCKKNLGEYHNSSHSICIKKTKIYSEYTPFINLCYTDCMQKDRSFWPEWAHLLQHSGLAEIAASLLVLSRSPEHVPGAGSVCWASVSGAGGFE